MLVGCIEYNHKYEMLLLLATHVHLDLSGLPGGIFFPRPPNATIYTPTTSASHQQLPFELF